MPFVADNAFRVFFEAVVAESEFVPDFGVLGVQFCTLPERCNGVLQRVQVLERYTAIEEGFVIDRIDPDGFPVCLQCFLAPSQRIERDSPVDMGFCIDRIQRKRLVVSLQRFLVSFEVVQENTTPHPGIRGMGHDAQQPVNDTQSIFVAALFEVVIGDIFQRIRIKPGGRVPS